ncbi:MAG: hypothetical protein B7O98_04275 [Zestosphaera tikiterensis]|uniref:Phosphatidic acid phosphatase type 2/haloperoxidase domain-containing protein n=1 Tax=Zestosphaera tikiterensis TaxID=1973259 RepID=A0A2R7Y7X5_9CREN|nr:MAG: hypothetical protein B7O98_04275 [Zestosphaera tikiterensis]
MAVGFVGKEGLTLYVIAAVLATLLIYGLITDSTNVWVFYTSLGDEYFYVAVFLILYIFIDAEFAYSTLSLVLFSVATNAVIKQIAAVERPPKEFWRIEAEGYSWPSRHAMTSATLWSYIALKFKNMALRLVGLISVLGISYSRVALGVHWLNDVVWGVIFGVLISLIFYLIQKFLGEGLSITYLFLAITAVMSLIAGFNYGDIQALKVLGITAALTNASILKPKFRSLNTSTLSAKLTASLTALATSGAVAVFIKLEHPIAIIGKYYLITTLLTATPVVVIHLFKHSFKN